MLVFVVVVFRSFRLVGRRAGLPARFFNVPVRTQRGFEVRSLEQFNSLIARVKMQ